MIRQISVAEAPASTGYIYSVVFERSPELDLLEAMKLLASPTANTGVHVTFDGPRKRRRSRGEIMRTTSKMLSEQIMIDDIGMFNGGAQKTVYFECTSTPLLQSWHKPDYPDSRIPHLTISDGSNAAFALELFAHLQNAHIRFPFGLVPRAVDETCLAGKTTRTMLFDARTAAMCGLASAALPYASESEVASLSESERLAGLGTLAVRLAEITAPGDAS